MRSKLTGFRIGCAFCLIVGLALGAFADTIRLKDGSLIKGRITSYGGGKFVVTVGGGGTRRKELSFSSTEVESIQFDQAPASSIASRPTNQSVSKASYSPSPPSARPASRVVTTENIKQPVSQPIKPPAAQPVIQEPAKSTRAISSTIKPIEIAVQVKADNTANGWTNSGWVVKKGQKIRISGDGEISLGGGKTTGPSGNSDLEDTGKLLKSVPTGALIAVIGDDNNDFIYIGSGREFTASRDGALFFGVNEGNLNDNSGAYSVKVEIEPRSGS